MDEKLKETIDATNFPRNFYPCLAKTIATECFRTTGSSCCKCGRKVKVKTEFTDSSNLGNVVETMLNSLELRCEKRTKFRVISPEAHARKPLRKQGTISSRLIPPDNDPRPRATLANSDTPREL